MRKILIVYGFLMIFASAGAQTLTDASVVSLLTGSPGEELYSTFGHSAIRIKDTKQGIDLVFNYGTFDFNTPNFYIKFMRGKLNYMLSVQRYDGFIYSFKYENRSVSEQVLNLDLKERNRLYQLLMENYKLENRFYKYDFFYDNCATRIRDILVKACDGVITFHYPEEWQNSGTTLRQLLDLFLTDHPWSDFGIDLILGLPTDKVAEPSEYMFLPAFLSQAFALATIERDGNDMPLVISEKKVLGRRQVERKKEFYTPINVAGLLFLFAAVLTFLDYKRKLDSGWFDILYFGLLGLAGWIVFLLWFFTDHNATRENWNILWVVPLHFPLFFFWGRLSRKFRHYYLWIVGLLAAVVVIFWSIIPQQYHIAFIPLIMIILIRVWLMLWKEGRPGIR